MPWKSHLGNCFSEVMNRPLLFLLHKKTRLGWSGFIRSHRALVVWSGKVLGRNHNFLLRETPQIGDFWLTIMYPRPKKKKSPIVIPLIRSANLRIRNQVAWHTSGPRELRTKWRPWRPRALGYVAGRVSFMSVLSSPWWDLPSFLDLDLNLQISSQSGLLPLPFPNLLFYITYHHLTEHILY